MCFSAVSSFSSAVILSSTGAAALHFNRSRSQTPYMVIPLLFAAQQFTEGFVWTTMADESSFFHKGAVLSFLFFASAFWPAWIPWAIFRMETNKRKRLYLIPLIGLGLLILFYATWDLYLANATAKINQHSIEYCLPDVVNLVSPVIQPWAYMFASILPFFISSDRRVKIVGGFMLTSLLMTIAYRHYAMTSVWCFFAAGISLFIALPPTLAALKQKQQI